MWRDIFDKLGSFYSQLVTLVLPPSEQTFSHTGCPKTNYLSEGVQKLV